VGSDCYIFVLGFVSPDFELGRNVIGEESTVSPARGYFCILFSVYLLIYSISMWQAYWHSATLTSGDIDHFSNRVFEL